MKKFCFIFIVYLLFLSSQPCQDFAENLTSHSKTSVQQTDLHDSREQTETDDCSPFCYCSCCSISFAYTHLEESGNFQTTAKISEKDFSGYQNPYSKLYSNFIWQPPKSRA